ncbi:hypothetical protein [Paenibacillus sp. RC67]|uniref:hypothetical protein n=1 Tax=Paenibacillus sp. RC67 TaxID=3039392 RepID=UPI0024AE4493|nr:hypothetical protein [Paenibacillus sp. RC67]
MLTEFVMLHLMAPLSPLIKGWSTPKNAGNVIAKLVTTCETTMAANPSMDLRRSVDPDAR